MSETVTKRMTEMTDIEGAWEIRAVDDQPIPEGRVYAPNLSVTISNDGEVVQCGSYPSYRIWTLLAHWREGIPYEPAPDALRAEGSGK